MGLSIVERTVNSETDQRLVVDGAYYARPLRWGNDWTKIRVGVRFGVNRTSAWTSPPYFYMGLSSGSAAFPTNNVAGCPQFFGWRTNSDWVYNTDIDRTIANNSTSGKKKVVVKNGTTTESDVTTANYLYARTSTVRRACMIMEITKGSPWSLNLYSQNDSTAEITLAIFNDAMQAGTISTTYFPYTSLATTETVDEATYGDLDTLVLSWLGTGNSNAFEISDIAVAKLS